MNFLKLLLSFPLDESSMSPDDNFQGAAHILQSDVETDSDEELDQDIDTNPNLQGSIRIVPNAHLVFKRETADGNYEELWIYNCQETLASEFDIRNAILAGTDIPVKSVKSPDGSQQYELVTMGNAQMLHITGLPN